MNRDILGTILLSAAGIILTVGIVGAQITSAIVQGAFYVGHVTGVDPPEHAYPHWLVIVTSLLLAGLGTYLLFRKKTRDE